MTTLEPAIPPYLREDRLISSQTPQHWEPPFPSYTARFPKSTTSLAAAYFGIQAPSRSQAHPHLPTLQNFLTSTPSQLHPSHHDIAAHTDPRTGTYNLIVIAYWTSAASYEKWNQESGFEAWFSSTLTPESLSAQNIGIFREIFLPTADRWETVFSNDTVPEGAAHMRDSVSGAIQEHGYWGSMRDRLPVTQVDDVCGRVWEPVREVDGSMGQVGVAEGGETLGKRIKLKGRENLAIIRSGQDWSDTSPEERKLYLEKMHPVLIKGMEFLRDHGEEVGCFSCRFMEVLPGPGSPEKGKGEGKTEKTFGLAYFDDLKSLEGWSKSHKTHLDIFGGFLQYAKELEFQISLRLFHEVLVLEPGQQVFEYLNCGRGTGMLAGR